MDIYDHEEYWIMDNRYYAAQRRRYISNVIGALALLVLLAIVGVVWVGNWMERRELAHQTKKLLKEVGDGFYKNDRDVITKWAKGEYKDVWGNQIVLDATEDGKYHFTSKGPDGEIGTADDIKGEVYKTHRQKAAEEALKAAAAITKPPEPVKEPEGPGVIEKAQQTVENAQKAVEKGEVSGTSWKFQWKWGKTKEAPKEEPK